MHGHFRCCSPALSYGSRATYQPSASGEVRRSRERARHDARPHYERHRSDDAGDAERRQPCELRLWGGRPNPSNGSLTASFSIPMPGSARIELVDLSGRVLARRVFSSLGAGGHVADFTHERFPVGIYFLQLHYAGRTLVSKVSVVR